MNTRLNPLNDYLFLKVMGEKGDEEQLMGFLNAVLGRTGKEQLASIEILENKFFAAGAIGDKTSILDVRAVLREDTETSLIINKCTGNTLSRYGKMEEVGQKRHSERALAPVADVV